MQLIETEWWTMALPEEWQASVDEDSVVVTDEDGIGVIEISAVKKDSGTIGPADLRAFCADLEEAGHSSEKAQLGPFNGRLFEYPEAGQWCRDWVVARAGLLLLVSYTCMAEDKGLDDAAVDEILETLELVEGE